MSSFCKYAKPRTLFKNFPLCYPSISFYTSFLQSLSVLSSVLLTASLFSSWYPRTVFTNQGSLTNDHESTVQCIQYSIYFLHVQYSCIQYRYSLSSRLYTVYVLLYNINCFPFRYHWPSFLVSEIHSPTILLYIPPSLFILSVLHKTSNRFLHPKELLLFVSFHSRPFYMYLSIYFDSLVLPGSCP